IRAFHVTGVQPCALPILVDGAGAGIASDADWAAAARGQLSAADARLARRYGPECDMDRLLALRARAVDLLLRQAWARCLPAVSATRNAAWMCTMTRYNNV